MDRPLLIRIPFSHFCRKAEWGLTQAGIPYDTLDVPLWKMREMPRITPAGTVPMMVIGSLRLTDSHSILVWADEHRLAERAALYPESQALHVAAWERWGDEEAAPAVRRESYRALWEDPAIFRGYPEMPLALKFKAVTKRVALGVLKHYKARRFEATDPAEVRKAIGKVAAQLSENGHGFLLGDKPTAADVSVAALMEPLTAIAGARGYADDPNWPIVRDYVLRVRPIKTLRRKTRGIKERHFATLEAAFPQEPPAEASPEQDAL